MRGQEKIVDDFQAGDRDALNDLFRINERLIWWTAGRFQGDQEDLRQEACVGFIKAAETWQAGKGTSFTTYAVAVMLRHLRRFVGNDVMIRIPEFKMKQIADFRRAAADFYRDHGRQATPSDLGMTADQVEKLRADAELLRIGSLDAPFDEDMTLLDAIADQNYGPLGAVEGDLWSEVHKLPDKQKEALERVFRRDQTRSEAAYDMGVSKDQFRTIEHAAYKTLRRSERVKALYADICAESVTRSGLGFFIRTGSSSVEWAVLRHEARGLL